MWKNYLRKFFPLCLPDLHPPVSPSLLFPSLPKRQRREKDMKGCQSQLGMLYGKEEEAEFDWRGVAKHKRPPDHLPLP